jgi:1,4-dihydroxy-2-naphthoate octaprenyltransferase
VFLTVLAAVWLIVTTDLRLALVALVVFLIYMAYSSGPWPYSYHAMGELGLFLTYGLIGVLVCVYVQTKALDLTAFLAASAVGFMAAGDLVVNNERDRGKDSVGGKRTLAVRLGRTRNWWLYRILITAACVMVALLSVVAGSWHILLPILALPLAAEIMMSIPRSLSTASVQVIYVKHIRLYTAFCFLLGGGLLWRG